MVNMKERIENLLAQPYLSTSESKFLNSLLDFFKNYNRLTEKQEQALKKVEERYDEGTLSRAEVWRQSFTDEQRQIAVICAKYYNATGEYYRELAVRILSEPEYIPSEKQYRSMCENKYAKKVIENTFAEPKYPVGSFVVLRAGASYHTRMELEESPALVIATDVESVTSAAKGSKKYSILPVRSSKIHIVEERYLKRCRK
jgi:hypothetical protein